MFDNIDLSKMKISNMNETVMKETKDLREKVNYNAFFSALVVSTKDPNNLGRVKIRIPSIHGISRNQAYFVADKYLPWARPGVFNSAGNDMGQFIVPTKGNRVFVTFEYNDPQHPIYFGGIPSLIGKTKKYNDNPDIYNGNNVDITDNDKIQTKRTGEAVTTVFKSFKGATIEIDDQDGKEAIRIIDAAGQVFVMGVDDPSGTPLERRHDKEYSDNIYRYIRLGNENEFIEIVDGKIHISADVVEIDGLTSIEQRGWPSQTYDLTPQIDGIKQRFQFNSNITPEDLILVFYGGVLLKENCYSMDFGTNTLITYLDEAPNNEENKTLSIVTLNKDDNYYDLTEQMVDDNMTFDIDSSIRTSMSNLVFYGGQQLTEGVNYNIDYNNHKLELTLIKPVDKEENRQLIIITHSKSKNTCIFDLTPQVDSSNQSFIIDGKLDSNERSTLLFYGGQLLIPEINYEIDYEGHRLITHLENAPDYLENKKLILIAGTYTPNVEENPIIKYVDIEDYSLSTTANGYGQLSKEINIPENYTCIDVNFEIPDDIIGLQLTPVSGFKYTKDVQILKVNYFSPVAISNKPISIQLICIRNDSLKLIEE
ncbi:MAG: hypothetical protein IJH34_03295 [Romboutsia sp.]|nr:hypothetical protein [Romboutsia sp.]